jgi:hypothetical protein
LAEARKVVFKGDYIPRSGRDAWGVDWERSGVSYHTPEKIGG